MQILKRYIPYRRFKISGHFIGPRNLFWTAPRNILNRVNSSVYKFKRQQIYVGVKSAASTHVFPSEKKKF